MDVADDLGEPIGFLLGHARRRFVEKNELRLRGEHDAELHELALAVGELVDPLVLEFGRLHALELGVDRGLDRACPDACAMRRARRFRAP